MSGTPIRRRDTKVTFKRSVVDCAFSGLRTLAGLNLLHERGLFSKKTKAVKVYLSVI